MQRIRSGALARGTPPTWTADEASTIAALDTTRGGLGGDDVGEVAKAVVEGRVSKLLVEADREVPGRVDRATGELAIGASTTPRWTTCSTTWRCWRCGWVATVEDALEGAAGKMHRSLETTLGRLANR